METYKADRSGWWFAIAVGSLLIAFAIGGYVYGRTTAPTPDPEIVEIPAVLEPVGPQGLIQGLLDERDSILADWSAWLAKVDVLDKGIEQLTPTTTTTTMTTAPVAEAQTD